MSSKSIATCACCVLFAAPALAETDAQLAGEFARHERFAGAPIEEIRNYRLYRWKPLGETAVAIWANPGELYLVEVEAPCNGLDWAKTIATDGRARVLMARFDSIVFANQRCRIERIRPVDHEAMRAESDSD